MNGSTSELTALIRQNRERLETIRSSIDDALDQEIAQLGKTSRSALIIAGLLENYYTALRPSSCAFRSVSRTTWSPSVGTPTCCGR